jgi:hypothetical protein
MSNTNYTLEIVSRHPKFNSRSLRKYYVDGIETVGVWGDEPFEIRFKNNTWQKVQVKLTLDGTDILTGKPADTEVSKDMWVVNGYATLTLKAWPETNNGGAAFVFTSANNSVAVHTHGDLSSRGIIAAAVFTEGHVDPFTIKLNSPVEQHHHHHHYERSKEYVPYYPGPIWIGGGTYGSGGITYTSNNSGGSFGGTLSSNTISSCNNAAPAAAGGISDCFYMNEVSDGAASASLESLVSVGAGEHVDQKITYVTGLIKPVFTETVRVKYLWWDDLQEKLRTQTKAQPQPSGFPGDHDRKNIDLKCTPRIGENRGSFRRVDQQPVVYDRF